jgi:hypothetical protein
LEATQRVEREIREGKEKLQKAKDREAARDSNEESQEDDNNPTGRETEEESQQDDNPTGIKLNRT